MQSIYTVYKCKAKRCKREIILLTEEVRKAISEGKYLACAYCGYREIEKTKETDDFKECFTNDERRR